MRIAARELAPGRLAVDERQVAQAEAVAIEVLAAAERDEVRRRVDARDVATLPERDAETAALPDRVRRDARRARRPARRRRPAAARASPASRRGATARSGSHRRGRSRSPGSRACPRSRGRGAGRPRGPPPSCGPPSGKRDRGELLLPEPVEEVRLVLVGVDARRAAGSAAHPRSRGPRARRRARSGRSRPRRSRRVGGRVRGAPRTSPRSCSRRTGSASGPRGRRRRTGP